MLLLGAQEILFFASSLRGFASCARTCAFYTLTRGSDLKVIEAVLISLRGGVVTVTQTKDLKVIEAVLISLRGGVVTVTQTKVPLYSLARATGVRL